MATATTQNTFTNGTNADANLVNANFAYLTNWLNSNVIQPDVANFTVFPTLPASTPTSAYQAVHKSYVDAFLPAGMIVQYVGATAPTGWRFCDGSTYNGSDTTYAALWAAVGTTYGGSGVGAFKVPDLRGRVPVGYGLGDGLTNRALGTNGGTENHLLTAAEIPSHVHNQGTLATSTTGEHGHTFTASTNHQHRLEVQKTTNASHTHNVNGTAAAGMSSPSGTTGAYNDFVEVGSTTLANGGHSHTITGDTGSVGGGGSHNNMQPFVVVSYLIKL